MPEEYPNTPGDVADDMDLFNVDRIGETEPIKPMGPDLPEFVNGALATGDAYTREYVDGGILRPSESRVEMEFVIYDADQGQVLWKQYRHLGEITGVEVSSDFYLTPQQALDIHECSPWYFAGGVLDEPPSLEFVQRF